MSGFACAVAAAREGISVILIERNGCLGGTGTCGGVNHLLGAKKYKPSTDKLSKSIAGLFDELESRLLSRNGACDPRKVNYSLNTHGWLAGLGEGLIFDVEIMKHEIELMCVETNVKLLYYTDVIDVVKDADEIKCVICHNKSGIFAVSGDYFADTTGDADIAYMSGCQFSVGDENGLMAPASLEMHVEGVDTKKLSEYIAENKTPRFREKIAELRSCGVWDFPYDIFISVQLVRDDVYMINTIRQVGINGLDGDSLTLGTIKGRDENFLLFEIMRKYFPGFENARIRNIAPVIGIRETRRIKGVSALTVDDLTSGKKFDDVIAYSGYGWDLPDPKSPSFQPMEKVKKSDYTPICYSCMVTAEVDNLIVAGRSISVERQVLGPIREMGPCIAMGQAAGVAASIAKNNKMAFRFIDVKDLRQKLKEHGAIADEDSIVEEIRK